MESKTESTKRIAKNTIILYMRMVIVMLIGLYTSRIVLKSLGVEDFGLYNVIGGVVGLFAFFRTSMEKAAQRFLNVEMVKENGSTNVVFSVNVTIHVFIALAIFILAESVGLLFLNSFLNIPDGREVAANWVYQSVILSLCLTVVSVPYSSCVIAHEKMSFYAVVSIVDAVLKLLIAFCLLGYGRDRLILYGCLMLLISIVNFLLYFSFCRIKYKETKFCIVKDRSRYFAVLKFVGWTMLGQGSAVMTNQGNGILVNIFHGVTANAAMSIGSQVNHAILNLSSNFQTAFNPQITKSYASKDYDYLLFLINITTKISFSLFFLSSLPIIFNIDWVLDVWLSEVPQDANIFCILFIANGILNALSAPLSFTVMASGNIKKFQIVTAVTYFVDLLIVALCFILGGKAYVAMVVKVCFMVVLYMIRLYFATAVLDCLTVKNYFKRTILPMCSTMALSLLCAFFFVFFDTFLGGRLVATIAMVLVALLFTLFVSFSKSDRLSLMKLLKHRKKTSRVTGVA